MQSERSLEEEFLPPFQESGLEKLSPGRDGLSWILKLDYEFLMQKQQKNSLGYVNTGHIPPAASVLPQLRVSHCSIY